MIRTNEEFVAAHNRLNAGLAEMKTVQGHIAEFVMRAAPWEYNDAIELLWADRMKTVPIEHGLEKPIEVLIPMQVIKQTVAAEKEQTKSKAVPVSDPRIDQLIAAAREAAQSDNFDEEKVVPQFGRGRRAEPVTYMQLRQIGEMRLAGKAQPEIAQAVGLKLGRVIALLYPAEEYVQMKIRCKQVHVEGVRVTLCPPAYARGARPQANTGIQS